MTELSHGASPRDADVPWGRVTLVGQLLFFAVPAVIAWSSSLDESVYLPLVALPLSLVAGLALLVLRRSRSVGLRVVGATVLAAGLEVALTAALVVAYSELNPGWDLS